MSFAVKVKSLMTSVNNLMGVIDGKLRTKADKTEIYTRTQLDDPTKTLGSNAATATKLKVVRTINLGGQATGSVGFDGSGNVTLVVSVPGLADKADIVDTLTPAQIDERIQSVIGAAPEALNTLNEIAEALGDDPNFAATMTAELSKKAVKADVYTIVQADAKFLTKSGKAADTALFGGQASDHYAKSSQVSDLESQVGDAIQQLADSFNSGANSIGDTTQ